jgi:hypothetical protein
MSGSSVGPMRVIADDAEAPEGWDERAVGVPGGHVMQSSTWADYRSDSPLVMRFLTLDDGSVALASLRSSSGLPGVEAVVRRGPAHRGDPAQLVAARSEAVAQWALDHGARDLFLDPEHDADPMYETAMDAAGFAVADDLEPSIHVMRLDLGGELDEATLFRRLSKSTRQRVRSAQDAGVRVRETADAEQIEAFDRLMRERADVLGIALQAGSDYLRGWRMLIEAGLARLLVAEHEDDLVGGLLIFKQAGMHATVFSADKASRRKTLPGTMHLVRWTAISEALAEGATAMELGGVDLPGHREPPRPGDSNRGLYEHKRGFGAEWVQRTRARRIVLRPWANRMSSARRRAVDGLRGVRR